MTADDFERLIAIFGYCAFFVFLVALYGYAANFFKVIWLARHSDDIGAASELAVRVTGIFVFPLGVVMGFMRSVD